MTKPLLERWVQFGSPEIATLIGYIFDSKEFPNGRRVQTQVIKPLGFNASCTEVSCADGDYRLGDPGTLEEHNVPLPGGIWKRPLIVVPPQGLFY